MRGNKGDSRLAARRVRKLLYSSQSSREKYEDIKNLVNSAPAEYAKISEEWRQENFAVAVNEIGPLTVHIRCPEYLPGYFGKPMPEQADSILHSLFTSLNGLLAVLWQPKYKRYKYIDSLPASPYKSVQMVLAELEESCDQKYMDRLANLTKPL